jgi:ribosomal protein S16
VIRAFGAARNSRAAQIIDEIKRLAPEEQAGVVRMVYQLGAEWKLNGPKLSALAKQFVNSQDPVEAARVCETIVHGFYGATA